MEVTEPSGRVTFRSRRRLAEHVIKHVLEGRDERWHQVLDVQLLAEARAEYRSGVEGPCFYTIARRYQEFVGKVLVEACRQGKGHRHLVRYRRDLSDLSAEVILCQRVDGYGEEEKLIFAAETFENQGGFGPYYLKTAYRPCPNLSPRATRRKARERLRNRQSVQLYRLIVEHGL